jgi:hypothetical protein
MPAYTVSFVEKEPEMAPAGTVHKIGIWGVNAAQVEVRVPYAIRHFTPFRPDNVSVVKCEEAR